MKQPSVWHVLQPKWRTMLQRVREERARGGKGKVVILAVVGLLFWLAVFGVLYKILKYFRGVEELGPLLAAKLLGLVLLSFVAILVLSNVITALSSFFLAKDLDLLVYGHSHVAALERMDSGGVFGNAGSWLDAPTFLKLTDVAIELREWDGSAEGKRLNSIDR